MPIYRKDDAGRFVPFETTAPELEKQLEDWIEVNPHLLLDGEPLAVIGRQTTTAFGKALDLLAVDQNGATVVVELKKGASPREVLAQALEYTAWIDSLSQDELDAIANSYGTRVQPNGDGVASFYDKAFGQTSAEEPEEEDEQAEPSANVTFNARQRIVIVAESFPGEMEQTLRYLRERLGVDVSAVRLRVHKLDQEELIETEVIVGRERTGSAKGVSSSSTQTMSHDEIRQKVATDFLRDQVDALEEWIRELSPGLAVQHQRKTRHSVYLNGQSLGGYYFATQWIHFWLKGRVAGDGADLKTLSNVASALLRPKLVAGNVATEPDLEILKRQLSARMSVRDGTI